MNDVTFVVNDSTYHLRWVHCQFDASELPRIVLPSGKRTNIRGCTICKLLKEGQEIYSEQAFCSVNDTYSKAKGRKISLSKLLSLTGWDKQTRSLVWDAYFGRKTYNGYIQ
jgi:hypothetical protein